LKVGDCEAHYNWGIALADKENYVEAIKHYRKTVKINPDHAMAWNNMGTAYEKQELREDAEKCYKYKIDKQCVASRLSPLFLLMKLKLSRR
jgi:tetratricopeptide (TPR) repeat protein